MVVAVMATVHNEHKNKLVMIKDDHRWPLLISEDRKVDRPEGKE